VIDPTDIGLSSIAAALPDDFVALDALRLRSKPDVLRGFGFSGAAIAHDLDTLVLDAAREALRGASTQPSEIGALFYTGALTSSHTRASAAPSGGELDQFCYRASWLQDALVLDRATVCGVAQQGCAGFFAALRQGRALLVAEPELQNVLCVGADAFGAEANREILYNVVSDAACAAVVSRSAGFARWLAYAQISKGYYWDVPAREAELIAAYFPTARAVIGEALARADLNSSEIDFIIPTGVNASSWPILLRLCGFSDAQLYRPAVRFGHTIAADSFLHLREARARGLLRPGMRVLLFTYGFGSSWCALVLELVEGAAP
jgi:3-oxoacyl-[acyl-carrier-protein] synthase-3